MIDGYPIVKNTLNVNIEFIKYRCNNILFIKKLSNNILIGYMYDYFICIDKYEKLGKEYCYRNYIPTEIENQYIIYIATRIIKSHQINNNNNFIMEINYV